MEGPNDATFEDEMKCLRPLHVLCARAAVLSSSDVYCIVWNGFVVVLEFVFCLFESLIELMHGCMMAYCYRTDAWMHDDVLL